MALLIGALPAVLPAQRVEVEELILDNGMKFLLVARPGDPHVAAGWVAKIGSVNERPGVTGIAHLFEHMMFKGTSVIGTTGIEAELEVLGELDGAREAARRHQMALIERRRRGEIDDADDPRHRSPEHAALLERIEALETRAREFIVKDELDRLYTTAGALGLNAGTSYDFTIYYVMVPANKLELWFWVESDRLLNPVFREFYSERAVVHEERRLRTDSTPLGRFEEQFESLFWQSSPYGWPIVGWPSDLENITREEALSFFDVYYAPNNLTACLVGDFDVAQARAWAETYFGRLRRGPREPEPVRTLEMPQQAEARMIGFADANPSVEIRYHSVADGHVDEPALVLLGSALGGRTGRLYRALVLERQMATSAGAGQNGFRYEGYFEFRAQARPPHTPEALEQAMNEEIERLKREPLSDRELEKVKNQELAARFRRLQSPAGLRNELLTRDALRVWRTINTDGELYQAVTAEDIRRAAEKYFRPEQRAVALYYRRPAEPAASGVQPPPSPAPRP